MTVRWVSGKAELSERIDRMRPPKRLLGPLVMVSCLVVSGMAWAAPLVSLELATEPGFPLGGERKWLMVLKDCKLTNIRFRSLRSGTTIEIKNRGTEESPVYLVTGVLTARNTLRLPGVEFRSTERVAIAKWIEKLKTDGMEGVTAQTGPFGLTKKQLLQIHQSMTGKVNFATRDLKSSEAIARIRAGLSVELVPSPAARLALAGESKVRDEVKGLSCGTALAIILRPLGLVLVPEKPSGKPVRLLIVKSDQVKEFWPIGWPPQKNPRTTMPVLFETLKVEIDKVTLATALSALAPRLKVPLVFDYNAMTRERIDLDKVPVKVPAGQTYYKNILDRVLSQAKLYCEVRVDEANSPFLWISTLKKL